MTLYFCPPILYTSCLLYFYDSDSELYLFDFNAFLDTCVLLLFDLKYDSQCCPLIGMPFIIVQNCPGKEILRADHRDVLWSARGILWCWNCNSQVTSLRIELKKFYRIQVNLGSDPWVPKSVCR